MWNFQIETHTSGHEYLDAEKGNCPKNTHWDAVWSVLYSVLCQFQFHFKFQVSRSGVQIPVKAIVSVFSLLPTFRNGQSMETISLQNFIHWLKCVVIRFTSQKWLWRGFEPQTWKRGIWCGSGTATARCRGKQEKRHMTAYCFTQRPNGCSLGSLLFPRQDNHVPRCMPYVFL